MSAYRILLSTYSSTAAQGLPSRALAFSSGGEPGSQFRSSARGTPPGFSCRARAGCRRAGFSRCSARTELPRAGIRDLPEPGIDLLSSALAGGFLVTGPPPAYHILSHWTTTSLSHSLLEASSGRDAGGTGFWNHHLSLHQTLLGSAPVLCRSESTAQQEVQGLYFQLPLQVLLLWSVC